jgi:hypothetical protein
MAEELMIELHSSTCECGGGSWVTGPGQGVPSCTPGYSMLPPGALLLPIQQWQAMGRPRNAEACTQALEQKQNLDRRRFKRSNLALKVRLHWPADATGPGESEETVTHDLGVNGACVHSRLPVEIGAILILEDVINGVRLRAQVRAATIREGGLRRLSLTFVDGTFPRRHIPSNAPQVGEAKAS